MKKLKLFRLKRRKIEKAFSDSDIYCRSKIEIFDETVRSKTIDPSFASIELARNYWIQSRSTMKLNKMKSIAMIYRASDKEEFENLDENNNNNNNNNNTNDDYNSASECDTSLKPDSLTGSDMTLVDDEIKGTLKNEILDEIELCSKLPSSLERRKFYKTPIKKSNFFEIFKIKSASYSLLTQPPQPSPPPPTSTQASSHHCEDAIEIDEIVEPNDRNGDFKSIDRIYPNISLDQVSNYESLMRRERINRLLQYPFYQIDIHLKYAENLIAKDSSGTSDPYVKFKIGNQIVYRSRTVFKSLNPIWDEHFVLAIENICEPIIVKVYDYDYIFMDDFLGSSSIDLTLFDPNISTDLELKLDDGHHRKQSYKQSTMKRRSMSKKTLRLMRRSKENLGKIFLKIRLHPRTQEEREEYYGRGKWTTITGIDGVGTKRIRSQPYESIISIVLIKGDRINLDEDYFVRIKLGNEKFKSRFVSKTVRSPYWAEHCDLHLYSNQTKTLELTLNTVRQNPNQFVDKVCFDLSRLKTDRTHRFAPRFNCKNGADNRQVTAPLIESSDSIISSTPNNNDDTNYGSIELLITITGLQTHRLVPNAFNDQDSIGPFTNLSTIDNHLNISSSSSLSSFSSSSTSSLSSSALIKMNPSKLINNLMNITDFFDENFYNIGILIVKVQKAENLISADLNGKSDPFCVIELVNERVRTNTEYKTLAPEWNKTFRFNIKDIHDVLELTVYDEDKDRCEFLGKIAIPLWKIRNGSKRWYVLKDKKLRHRSRGHIFLEFWISYNLIKASMLTFTPRQTKYIRNEIKFKRSLLIKNSMRLKNIGMEMLELFQFIHSCILWESPSRSLIAFLVFLISVYYFELYMIPMILLLLIVKNYLTIRLRKYFKKLDKISNQNNRNDSGVNNANDTNVIACGDRGPGGDLDDRDNDDDDDDDDFIDENSIPTKDFDLDKNQEKKTFKEKLHTAQEMSTFVMNLIGHIASYFERVKNASNFTVPYLSWLAVISMIVMTIVFYFVPLRYLILLWGINKFTKKFRSPDAIDNNELIDFLSRIPDMEEKIMYKEFRPKIISQRKDQSTAMVNELNQDQAIESLSLAIEHQQPLRNEKQNQSENENSIEIL
ncbi:hypothetical protein NH340_JMT02222 [Sarcoptes scabiei]|nr:hypothetical protein NH340_JMT02222 [Sarcoptes scabiei]